MKPVQTFRHIALYGSLLGIAASAFSQAATAYQLNPAHTGSVNFTTELKFPLVKKWTATFPGQLGYPIIAEGKIFVLSAGINDGNGAELYALDAATGNQLWKAFIESPYKWAGLTYGDGRLFALGGGGEISSFDPATGRVWWAKLLTGQYSFTSAPTFSGKALYIGGSGSGGTLYSLKAFNGKVLWKQNVANGDNSSPCVGGGHVYVGYAGNQVYSFRTTTGDLRWRYSTGISGGGGKTTVLSALGLYTRDSGGKLILSPKTGLAIGTHKSTVAPAIFGGTMVGVTNRLLSGTNEADGKLLWTFDADKNIVTAPIIVNGYVFAGSSSGKLYAIRRLTGGAVWSEDLGTSLFGPDEQNVSQPLTGLSAGDGLIVIPAGKTLIAYESGK